MTIEESVRFELQQDHRELEAKLREAEEQNDVLVAKFMAAESRAFTAEREMAAILDTMPADVVVRVREGAGPESGAASLAVSVAKLRERMETAERECGRLQKMLDVCSVVHGHNVKLKSELDEAQRSAESAVQALGAMRDELVSAGCPGGDREVALANLRQIVRARDAALTLLRRAVPEDDGWWCPSCRDALPGGLVTYDERCVRCGTGLGEISTPQWVADVRAALGEKP